MDMSENQQLMEITARTVSIARSTAIASEQTRILSGIAELVKGKHLTPECIMLVHQLRKIVSDSENS